MRIPDNVKSCVVFIAIRIDTERFSLCGTGFFTSTKILNQEGQMAVNLVTAKHVLIGAKKHSASIDNKLWIRINTRDGGYKYVAVENDQWVECDDSSIDCVTVCWCPNKEIFDFLCVPDYMFLSDEIIKNNGFGEGDEIFIIGLFINHAGRERNIPIVRMGNMAAMPAEKVMASSFGEIDAYLVEARSIGGLSGSPVFAQLGGVRTYSGKTQTAGTDSIFFLGLMHGHWDIPVLNETQDSADVGTTTDESSLNFNKEAVNMGIAIVIPNKNIMKVIDLAMARQNLIRAP